MLRPVIDRRDSKSQTKFPQLLDLPLVLLRPRLPTLKPRKQLPQIPQSPPQLAITGIQPVHGPSMPRLAPPEQSGQEDMVPVHGQGDLVEDCLGQQAAHHAVQLGVGGLAMAGLHRQ